MNTFEPVSDPVFDRGMTAHANRLPRSANPHQAGSPAYAAWEEGWAAGDAREADIAGDGALL